MGIVCLFRERGTTRHPFAATVYISNHKANRCYHFVGIMYFSQGSGFSPGDNLYFISSNRDNCLKGHKFIVKVKQDPACHAACCSNSDEYCFFRDSSPELNCIFAASDFPVSGIVIFDSNH